MVKEDDGHVPWTPPPGSWASSNAIRRTMQSTRGRDTSAELAVRSAVHARGLRYRVSQRPIQSLARTADLVFTRARVAVFVDGCYWHGCPLHFRVPATNAEFWLAKIEGNRVRDVATDRVLVEHGWRVIRIWEHDSLGEATERVVAQVAASNRANAGLRSRPDDSGKGRRH